MQLDYLLVAIRSDISDGRAEIGSFSCEGRGGTDTTILLGNSGENKTALSEDIEIK
jgi:hypothetical protein